MQQYETFKNIGDSLRLAWKYKILWLFSALLIATTSQFNPPSGTSSSSEDKKYPPQAWETVFEDVKGTADARPELNLTNPNAGDIVLPIALIALTILLVVVFFLIIQLVVKSWAQAALVHGTILGIKNTNPEFADLGNIGMARFADTLKLSIWITIKVVGSLILLGLLCAAGFVVHEIVGGILALVGMLIWLVYVINLSLAAPMANRLIVVENHGFRDALREGMRLYKKSSSKFYKLALGNCLVSFSMFFVMALLIGALIIPLVLGFSMDNDLLAGLLYAIIFLAIIPLLIAFVVVMQVMGSFFNTFTQFTWSNLYLHLKELNNA